MSLSGPVWTIAALVALVAFVVYAARRGEAMERERKARLSRARRASATVLSTKQSSGALRYGGRHGPEVILELLVDGRAVTARWYVLSKTLFTFSCSVDADDRDIVYPAEDWAELSLPQRHAIQPRAR